MQTRERDLPRSLGPEAELSVEQRLAAQMRALAQIAPAVAHDLRAPINAMVLNLEVLKESVAAGRGAEPAGRERLLRYTNVLREELARLHHSLEIFLAHISPRTDRVETLDLREVAGDLAALLIAPARKHQVEVAAELPPSAVTVTVNRYLLRQALLHLGLAALAALHGPGRLLISLETADGRARLRLTSPGLVAAPSPAVREQLETACALLAGEGGRGQGWAGEQGEGEGFEVELPLSEVK